MAHAIIRGANGRRHDVDFEGADTTVEIFFGDDTVEIAVAAPGIRHLRTSGALLC